MHFKVSPVIPALFLTASVSATALWATMRRATITKARITDRDKAGYGALRITVDGMEKVHVRSGVHKAWVIEDGGAVIYTTDGGRAMDFHTHTLLRHDEVGSGDGDMLLLGRFSEINDVRVWHSGSGKPALVVYGTQDATGSPTAAIVHPVRGVVWRRVPARVTGLREGKITVAEYAPETGGNPADKPLRTVSLDLDPLLARPVLKPL